MKMLPKLIEHKTEKAMDVALHLTHHNTVRHTWGSDALDPAPRERGFGLFFPRWERLALIGLHRPQLGLAHN